MPLISPAAFRRLLAAVMVVITLVVTSGSPAFAHTGFESSSPSDGETVDGPISEISLVFTGDASPAGEGFVILGVDGIVRIPDEVTTNDNLTWTLRFDDALTGGVIGVRWSVAAPDAHPIDGSFSFTVAASGVDEAVSTAAAAETQPATQFDSESADSGSTLVDLEEFLDTSDDNAAGASLLAGVARAIGLLGSVGAIGGIVFAAFVLRGDQRDVRAVIFWVRQAGTLVVIGATTELISQIAMIGQGWSSLSSTSIITDVLLSSFGAAVMLRLVGGVLVTGAQLHTRAAADASDPVARQLATVGEGRVRQLDDVAGQASARRIEVDHLAYDGDEAWHPSTSPAAFLGVGLLAISFLFDGHTVSEGPRWLHAIANLAHVASAATWAGGVVMLAMLVIRRHRRGVDARALQLGARFSVVAVVALVAASVPGLVLSVVILDSVSEIWSTSWGQLLVLKLLLVMFAAACGGYNHRVLIPDLEQAPDSGALAQRFKTIVTAEAAVLVAVVIVTALLIGASSA